MAFDRAVLDVIDAERIGDLDDPPEVAGSALTEKTFSVHANLFFDPVPNSRIGIEYIRGEREVYDGREGTLNRVQFSAMLVF